MGVDLFVIFTAYIHISLNMLLANYADLTPCRWNCVMVWGAGGYMDPHALGVQY